MADWEDYYEILEVDPDASPVEIRRAYRKKVLASHPDRMFGVSDELKRAAEERLKEINRANEVLSDPDERRRFHAQWLSRNSPPKPEVDRTHLRFADAPVGQTVTASIVVRNAGGEYSRIRVSNPSSWVDIVGYESLSDDDELPLRVDIETRGDEPGTSYIETITVALDDQETEILVELNTRGGGVESAAVFSATGPGAGPAGTGQGTVGRPGYWSPLPRPMTCAIDGMRLGMISTGVAGMVVMIVVAVVSSFSAFGTAPAIFFLPFLAVLYGVVGGLLGGVAGAIGGAIVGVLYGAFTRA